MSQLYHITLLVTSHCPSLWELKMQCLFVLLLALAIAIAIAILARLSDGNDEEPWHLAF